MGGIWRKRDRNLLLWLEHPCLPIGKVLLHLVHDWVTVDIHSERERRLLVLVLAEVGI